jgi:hypothetical protein
MNVNPKVVKLKVKNPGFHAEVRLWMAANIVAIVQ